MRELTPAELEELLAATPDPVLVDFFTAGCRPCRAMEPHLNQLELQSGLPVVRIDAAAAPELCERWGVSGVPTLLLLRAGAVVARRGGFGLLRELRDWLRAAGTPVAAS